ncbi:hypothetical protein F4809DRAFT_177739 [Biscogniauxia mediterranea]|nr:hypothetical protein F4809DRAFT_177739 [Biscogniauxia mediterranea]
MDTGCQVQESALPYYAGDDPIHGTGTSSHTKSVSVDRRSEVSSSGIAYSPNHAQAQDKQPEGDFRAKEPHQTWTEQNWDETRRPRKKEYDQYEDSVTSKNGNEGEFIATSYLQEYIENWRAKTHQVVAHFLDSNIKNSEECDVDTMTGELLPPVEYPFTKSGHDEAGKITSEMQVKLFCSTSSKEEKKAEKKAKKAAREAALKAAQEAANVNPPEMKPPHERLPDPDEVLVPCHLRPVEESDIEGVAEIYNNEVKNGYKVMDVNPVSVEDFRELFLTCVHEKSPFSVAVQGWHQPHTNHKPRILGFALVDAVSRGITGSYFTRSRLGGRITVIVHPDFRRKRIGSALIDSILSSCSRIYFPKRGYPFRNPHGDRRLMRPEYHPERQWHYLEMDVIIRSGENEEETRKGEEFQWIWNYLEERRRRNPNSTSTN